MESITTNGSDQKDKENENLKECPLCATKMASTFFPKLMGCEHQICEHCLKEYVTQSIVENRVEVSCPECPAFIHPSDIALIVDNDEVLINKYEQYSLRRVLLSDSDARWCPAPDCGYAVIASNCKDCPKLKCERAECGVSFCYNCKLRWQENHSCKEAERNRIYDEVVRTILHRARKTTVKPGDLKACPQCQTKILKADGSCNYLVCAVCNTQLCWLCSKEITEMHYFTPTGCTWFGRKQWDPKKTIRWRIGTLVGAPILILLIGALLIPTIIVGGPIFVGYCTFEELKKESKMKRLIKTVSQMILPLVAGPFVAALTVGVGVPYMFAYIYTVIPYFMYRDYGRVVSNRIDPLSEDIDELEEIYGTGMTMLEDIRREHKWDKEKKSSKEFFEDYDQVQLAEALPGLDKLRQAMENNEI